MKQLRFQIHRLSVIKISVILLLIGLFLGILCANLFKGTYIDAIREYEDTVFSKIALDGFDHAGLFRYVLGKNFNEFVVFWLLSITILGIPYMTLKITSFGFFTGFFVSAVTLHYGLKGILLILAYVLPQGLLYLPIAFISLYKGYELCSMIYRDGRTRISEIFSLFKSNLFIILLLAIALLVASFLEAYPGAFLLKKALGIF